MTDKKEDIPEKFVRITTQEAEVVISSQFIEDKISELVKTASEELDKRLILRKNDYVG